jgi:hypothetical protein
MFSQMGIIAPQLVLQQLLRNWSSFQPGQTHELLGDGIEECVVLSAGSRLELLRQRVLEGYGKFEVQSAIDLMDRPVAMESNLHNVPFGSREGYALCCQCQPQGAAAESTHVEINLIALLSSLQTDKQQISLENRTSGPAAVNKNSNSSTAPAAPATEKTDTNSTTAISFPQPAFDSVFKSRDSLQSGVEPSEDAKECLAGLCWPPASFEVRLQKEVERSWRCTGSIQIPTRRWPSF